MDLKKGFCVGLTSLVLAANLGSNGGCITMRIRPEVRTKLEQRVKTVGYFAGFEGMQPVAGEKIKRLSKRVAWASGIAGYATSGNVLAHLPIIEEAHRNNQPIYIFGHSSGGNEARMLAKECKKRNIPVKILFLSDPTYLARPLPGKITDNVERVITYLSEDEGWFFGVAPKKEDLEDPYKTILCPARRFPVNHYGLPMAAESSMEEEITKGNRKP